MTTTLRRQCAFCNARMPADVRVSEGGKYDRCPDCDRTLRQIVEAHGDDYRQPKHHQLNDRIAAYRESATAGLPLFVRKSR